MAFFPDRFHAQPDPRTGQVRLAVRVSEGRVSEYWLDPAEVAQIIDVPVDGEWHGDGMIQLRFKNNAGQLALHEDNDTRSLIRAPESTLRSLQAHLRSALLALDGVPLKPTKGLGVVVREAMAAELGSFRDDLQLMLREENTGSVGQLTPYGACGDSPDHHPNSSSARLVRTACCGRLPKPLPPFQKLSCEGRLHSCPATSSRAT